VSAAAYIGKDEQIFIRHTTPGSAAEHCVNCFMHSLSEEAFISVLPLVSTLC